MEERMTLLTILGATYPALRSCTRSVGALMIVRSPDLRQPTTFSAPNLSALPCRVASVAGSDAGVRSAVGSWHGGVGPSVKDCPGFDGVTPRRRRDSPEVSVS